MVNVRLLAYTQVNEDEGNYDPETLLASEKRVCNTNEIWDSIVDQDLTEKRIFDALKQKHMGVFEHLSLTFLIEDCSRVMTHQLVRHRMASYLQTSQRVTKLNDLNIIIPPSVRQKLLDGTFKDTTDVLKTIYQDLLDAGVPTDDARYIMPHGMATRIIMTINARALMHFLRLRTDLHAQWEIRDCAEQMLTLVRDKFPLIFNEKFREFWE